MKETLLPALRPGDIVVMDNMRSHHVKDVREILEAKGMRVLYLPPYSPDLSPIEKMWSRSKMKAILRKWKIRCLEQPLTLSRGHSPHLLKKNTLSSAL